MKMYRPFCAILLLFTLSLSSCTPGAPAVEARPSPTPPPTTDLSAIKAYLLDRVQALQDDVATLQGASDAYYALAATTDFDYAALWAEQPTAVSTTLAQAKSAWIAASPRYEEMEGIVAGVPTLAPFDLILDAGAAGDEDPANAVPFDLTLPDGRVLPKPGNLFGVTESALWGTEASYIASDVQADLNGNGVIDFGEALPDANVLKAGVDALADYTAQLATSAAAWQPTTAEAFRALVVMIPTMSEYFDSWKNSRYVSGAASTQRDFVAISRLADVGNILASLQVVYSGVKPLVQAVAGDQADQIETDLANLKAFVADVYAQEQAGAPFTPEEADLLGAEAQNRSTAIAGQVAQVAAQLNISVE